MKTKTKHKLFNWENKRVLEQKADLLFEINNFLTSYSVVVSASEYILAFLIIPVSDSFGYFKVGTQWGFPS